MLPVLCRFLLLTGTFAHIITAFAQTTPFDSILAETNVIEDDSLRIYKILMSWDRIKYKDPALSIQLLDEAERIAEEAPSAWGKAMVQYNRGAVFLMEGKYPEAGNIYRKALDYFESTEDTVYKHNIRHNLVQVDYDLGRYQSVVRQVDSLLEIFKDEIPPSLVASLTSLKGLSHNNLGNNLLAMQAFIPSVKYFEAHKDTARWADNLVYLSYTQFQMKKYEEARNHVLQAIPLYQKLEDWYFLGQAYNDIGNYYLEMDRYDSARYYLGKSVEINQQYDFPLLGINYMNLGKVWQEEGDLNLAGDYLAKAMQMFTEKEDARNISSGAGIQAEILLEQGRIPEAYQVLEQGMQVSEERYYPGKRNLFAVMGETLGRMGRWKEAAENWKTYVAVLDTMNKKESTRQQNELMVVYETEKKEKALLLEKQENETLRQEAVINELKIRTLWISGALLLGIAVLIFVIYRQNSIKKQLIQEREKKALEQALEFKKRELTTHTLHLVSKNMLLNELKENIDKLKSESQNKQPYTTLIGSIDHDLRNDEDWENFEKYFKQVHSDFDEKIKRAFSNLTGNEIRLVTLMKMNLSTKEIATILNITPESVNKARYRLRKKLNLDTDQNLQQFILAL